MSHTFESVLEGLGNKAQVVGGVITVYDGGKHTDIGRIDNTTGVFTLTAEGLLFLEGEPAPKKRTKGKTAAPAAEDLGSEEPTELTAEDIPLE